MSRVIQLISHNQHLFALTDVGEIFQLRKRRVKCRIEEYWHRVTLPSAAIPAIPPRFSLPEEYTPAPCQGSATEPEDSPDFNSLNGPGQGVPCSRQIRKHNPLRRPTSIGSDGNYIPQLGD